MKPAEIIEPNYQDLLKYFAIITMVIDHLGLFILFESWMRVIGRFAAPIFLFFAGYNYFRKKHEGLEFCFELSSYRTILLLGIACQLITVIHIPDFSTLNILIAISVGLFLVDIIVNFRIPDFIPILVLIALWQYTYKFFDYGTLSPAFIYLGYLANFNRGKKFILFAFLCLAGQFHFTYSIMPFSDVQLFIVLVEFAIIFYSFTQIDFEKKVKGQVFINSRHALPIYVIHYSALASLCGFIYFM
jgi:hypothetical protein